MAVLWPYPEDAFHYSARVDREDADQSVADGVTARLLGHDGTGDQPIKVTVQNRVAILTGAVDSLDVAILAGDLAWRTPGVVDVCNALTTPEAD